MSKRTISFLLFGLQLMPLATLGGSSTTPILRPDGISLDSLYSIAETESRLLQSSKTALESASEGTKAAYSKRLPSVSVSASGSYTGNAVLMDRKFSTDGTADYIVPGMGIQGITLGKQKTPHWGNNFALEVNQVLYEGGAIKAEMRMADLSEQIAEMDVKKNRQEIRFMLTGYYLELQKLVNQTKVIDRNINLTQQLIDDTRNRIEQGLVIKNDLTRFELQMQQLKLARQQVQNAAKIIHYQLTQTLHLPENTQFENIGESTLVEHNMTTSLEEWQNLAIQQHLGLQQVSASFEIAIQKFKITRAASLPHVGLQLADRLGGPYTQDLIPTDANTNVWYAGLGIQYDISSLYRNNHAKHKAQLNVHKAQEDLELAKESVNQSVQAIYTDYLTAQTEVQTQEKSVELAVENYNVIENRYSNQLCLLTDLLDATSAKHSAELALVNARINLLYNYYKLKYITSSL